jgi:hypothetical protein
MIKISASWLGLLLLLLPTVRSQCETLRFQGCDACTASDCVWCGADAACFPAGQLADALAMITMNDQVLTCTAEDFSDTCPANSNFFPDPLFNAQDWIYDMINVKPVWEAGISKFLLRKSPPTIEPNVVLNWSHSSLSLVSALSLQRALGSLFESTITEWTPTIRT